MKSLHHRCSIAGSIGRRTSVKQAKFEKDLRLLFAGAAIGLVAAAFGILRQESSDPDLPEYAVAIVNGAIISRDAFERAKSIVNSTADGVQAGEDTAVLQQLVHDELLVQRALELGMTASDLAVRQSLIDSLVASVTAEADAANPTDDELARHLETHAERFSFTSRIAIEAWQSDKESAAQQFAEQLRSNQQTETTADVDQMQDLPSDLIPIDVAVDYVGPGIAAAAASMPEGSSAVFARRGRWLVIRLRAKERGVVTDVSRIRNRVLIDYRRQLAEDALEAYLQDLRSRSEITTSAR